MSTFKASSASSILSLCGALNTPDLNFNTESEFLGPGSGLFFWLSSASHPGLRSRSKTQTPYDTPAGVVSLLIRGMRKRQTVPA
ncbi:hypothetical protein BDN70DRAFT_992467 [Pholiota conissans]|uniref:Uncharacterized protein n=1 Tax=Pholiota conissans TaxID=109636 RepID=A0A9P5Z439_9AGAR|nr:hypothetical protein BDN70DRAFT_992467 [Pholiota conissans]